MTDDEVGLIFDVEMEEVIVEKKDGDVVEVYMASPVICSKCLNCTNICGDTRSGIFDRLLIDHEKVYDNKERCRKHPYQSEINYVTGDTYPLNQQGVIPECAKSYGCIICFKRCSYVNANGDCPDYVESTMSAKSKWAIIGWLALGVVAMTIILLSIS